VALLSGNDDDAARDAAALEFRRAHHQAYDATRRFKGKPCKPEAFVDFGLPFQVAELAFPRRTSRPSARRSTPS
jgi:hypothetical protein